MGSKRKREILGGEMYGAAMMLIKVGYDMALHFPEPTAMVQMLALHPSPASTVRQPERVEVQSDVAVAEFIDAFGNRCRGHDLRTAS
jgi:transglutaminase-like putative cysteine protease